MARYRQLKSLDDYRRAIRNGYGLGCGEKYKPWLRVQDVRSKGLSEKITGIKTGRVHHLLSQGESEFFRLAEYGAKVVDIREQFPLLPMTLGKRIAEALGVKFPKVPGTDTDHIMTTDFVLTLQSGMGSTYRAVSVKQPRDLMNSRTLEKQEIERVWWQLLGVPFSIFCSNELTKIQAENIGQISNPLRRGFFPDAHSVEDALSCMDVGVLSRSACIDRIALKLDVDTNQAVDHLNHLIWTRRLVVDLDKPILETGLLRVRKTNREGIANVTYGK